MTREGREVEKPGLQLSSGHAGDSIAQSPFLRSLWRHSRGYTHPAFHPIWRDPPPPHTHTQCVQAGAAAVAGRGPPGGRVPTDLPWCLCRPAAGGLLRLPGRAVEGEPPCSCSQPVCSHNLCCALFSGVPAGHQEVGSSPPAAARLAAAEQCCPGWPAEAPPLVTALACCACCAHPCRPGAAAQPPMAPRQTGRSSVQSPGLPKGEQHALALHCSPPCLPLIHPPRAACCMPCCCLPWRWACPLGWQCSPPMPSGKGAPGLCREVLHEWQVAPTLLPLLLLLLQHAESAPSPCDLLRPLQL